MRTLDRNTLDRKVFVGKVVDNNDPEKEGRCRVDVFGVFTGLSIDQLPWAHPGHRKMFAGSKGGFADISIPKIGTFVQIRFIEGDIYNMEYVGIQNLNPTVQKEIEGSYLNSHVIAYDTDEDLKIFYTPSKGVEIYLKRSHITINPDSSITIEHADSDSLIELVGPVINIVANSTVNVTANSLIKCESSEVAMNGTAVTKMGPAPVYSAMLAEPTWVFLKSLAAAVDGKMPSTPGVYAAQAAAAEKLATSSNVKLSQ